MEARESSPANTAVRRAQRSRLVWSLAASIALIIGGSGTRIGLMYYRQQKAIAQIRAAHGTITLAQIGPPWLRALLGDARMEGFDDVIEVRLSHTDFTDLAAEKLACLTSLQHLDLNGTLITSGGLAPLRDLTRLKWLQLNDTRVGDAGLAHLKGLRNLRFLNLVSTQVSDPGLENLKGLTGLEDLWLGRTGISDAGLADLKGLVRLRILWVDETAVTDTGIAELKTALPQIHVFR